MRESEQRNLINKLPDFPNGKIIWVVYNEYMVDQAKDLIRDLKGSDYMKNVLVVSKSLAYKHKGHIYFDPNLYEMLSNGYD